MQFDWLLGGREVPVNYTWKDIVSIRTPALEVAVQLDRFAHSRLAWYENEVRTRNEPATIVASMPMNEPFVFLHVQLQGSDAITLPGAKRECFTTKSGISLRHSQEVYGFLEVPGGHIARSFGIVAAPQALADWFGGRVPPELRDILAQKLPGIAKGPVLDATVFQALAARIGDYLDPLRRIAAEGIAMQMMTAYLQALCGRDANSSSLNARERRAAQDARTLLLADLRQPPSASELATMVGLSERRLDQAFRELFGASIFRTLSNARLDHARDAMLRGNVTVKELAFRLGYAHSASFSHAFRARFGVFPSQAGRS